MFDTYRIQQSGDRLVPYEKTVTERRAPTDESVRLLREMEAEAARSVAMAFVTRDTAITDAVVQFRPSPAGNFRSTWMATVGFKLNGQDVVVSEPLDMMDLDVEGPQRAIELLRCKLADAIMAALTPMFFDAVMGRAR